MMSALGVFLIMLKNRYFLRQKESSCFDGGLMIELLQLQTLCCMQHQLIAEMSRPALSMAFPPRWFMFSTHSEAFLSEFMAQDSWSAM